MELTRANYHSIEAAQEYMSRGQYQDFCECEARAVAIIRGEWVKETTTAMLSGSYVHAALEGEEEKALFVEAHPEIISSTGKTKGCLKSDFVQAETMIETIQNDPACMYMLEGEKEVIRVAEMFGTLWKIRMDVYNLDRGRIVDIKTTKSIREKTWSDLHDARVSFVEAGNYLTQAAIYCEVERLSDGRGPEEWADFYIVAVSKEDPPDKEIISLVDPIRYREILGEIERRMPRILGLKAGEIEPCRCERCSYCRGTRKITKALHYTDL